MSNITLIMFFYTSSNIFHGINLLYVTVILFLDLIVPYLFNLIPCLVLIIIIIKSMETIDVAN